MWNKLENWALNVFAGKMIARAAVLIAGYVAGPVVQGIAGKAGVSLSVDSGELSGAMMIGFNWLFEWFKKRRMASPASPATQTDPKLITPLP